MGGDTTSVREHPSPDEALRDAHRIESTAWSVCAALAVAAMVRTLRLDSPEPWLAFGGEAAVLATAVGLAAASLWRSRRLGMWAGTSLRAQLAAVTRRISLGVPTLLVLLLAASAR